MEDNNPLGSKTLLVVDDDLALLTLIHSYLTEEGYRVLTAQDGGQALLVLEKESVDLIISDVIMPNMDGYQLAAQVKQRYPHIKLQMISGFEGNRHNKIDDIVHKNLLPKPFALKTLLARVRTLLDDGSDTRYGTVPDASPGVEKGRLIPDRRNIDRRLTVRRSNVIVVDFERRREEKRKLKRRAVSRRTPEISRKSTAISRCM